MPPAYMRCVFASIAVVAALLSPAPVKAQQFGRDPLQPFAPNPLPAPGVVTYPPQVAIPPGNGVFQPSDLLIGEWTCQEAKVASKPARIYKFIPPANHSIPIPGRHIGRVSRRDTPDGQLREGTFSVEWSPSFHREAAPHVGGLPRATAMLRMEFETESEKMVTELLIALVGDEMIAISDTKNPKSFIFKKVKAGAPNPGETPPGNKTDKPTRTEEP